MEKQIRINKFSFLSLIIFLLYLCSNNILCISNGNNNNNLNLNFNQVSMEMKSKIQKLMAYSSEYSEIKTMEQKYEKFNFYSSNDEKTFLGDMDKNPNIISRNLYAYYHKPEKKIEYTTKHDKNLESNLIAYGKFKNTRYNTGWDKLRIKTFANGVDNNPLMQCFSAGFIEGAISTKEIYYYYKNIHVFFKDDESYIEKIKNFFLIIDKNIAERIKDAENFHKLSESEIKDLAYISCLHAQINGLYEGYNSQAENDEKLSLYDFYFINSEGNFGDLKSFMRVNNVKFNNVEDFYKNENLYSFYKTNDISKIWKDLVKKGHCSGIVKLIEDPKTKMLDIMAGHNTWSDYSELIRVLKFVSFAFEGDNLLFGLKPKTLNFSSYPGVLFSGDDFYVLDTKVVLIQSTLNVINKFVYRDLIDMKKYIPEFMRLQITNFSSNSAVDWVNKYKSWENHMYITQWMAVDFNVLKKLNDQRKQYFVSNPNATSEDLQKDLKNPDKFIQSGLIILAEEAPKSILSKDLTQALLEKGYYGSFNISYFPKNQEILGMKYFKNVNFFDKEYNPRFYILGKIQENVKNLESFKDLMMYNSFKKNRSDFKDDPSFYDAGNGISARYDLSSGTYNGGIDFKVIYHI